MPQYNIIIWHTNVFELNMAYRFLKCFIGIAIVAYQNVIIIRWHKLASRQFPLAINCNCMQFIVKVQQKLLEVY